MSIKKSIMCVMVAAIFFLPGLSLLPTQAQDAPQAVAADAEPEGVEPTLQDFLIIIPLIIPILFPDAPP